MTMAASVRAPSGGGVSGGAARVLSGTRRPATGAVILGVPGVRAALPFAEGLAALPVAESRDVVGGDTDRRRAGDREQVRCGLGVPAGFLDGFLGREDSGDAVGAGVQIGVLGAAVGVDPPEVAWRIGFDEMSEEADFFGVGVEVHERARGDDP